MIYSYRNIINIIRYLLRSIFFLPFANMFGLIVLLFLYTVKPFKFMKICRLRVERIGSLATDTDMFLRRLQLKKNSGEQDVFYIGIADSKIANRQLLKMFKPYFFTILPNAFVFNIITNSNILKKSAFYEVASYKATEFYEYNNTEINLHFTSSEEDKGKELLNEMNVNSWFICFHSRDPTYLYAEVDSSIDWSYHNYRNSDIKNYLCAAKYITDVGGFALRMGSVVADKLPDLNNPRIIDYASYYRTDFGDIYLHAKCKFSLGDTAGIWTLPTAFHVPVACVNHLSTFDITPYRKGDLFIPKKVWSVEEKRFLTFREILESDVCRFFSGEQFSKAGLVVVENTAEEILDLTKEMNERLDGTFEYTKEDEELQNKYHSLIQPHHRCYGTPARIGAKFLRQNKELLE